MKKLLVVALICLLVLSLFWNYRQYMDLSNAEIKVEERTVIRYVEKKDSMPEAKTEKVVGAIKVPVCSKSAGLCSDSSAFRSEKYLFCSDSVQKRSELPDSIELEITQKVYSDSSYTAYVSGYMPNLDSIVVRQKEIIRTVIETRTIESTSRWNVGIVAGYGYGFQSKTCEPFVGVGVIVNLNNLFKRKK